MRPSLLCTLLLIFIVIAGCSTRPSHIVSSAQGNSTGSTSTELALPAPGQRIRLRLHDGHTVELRVTAANSDAISGIDSASGAAVRIATTDIQQWQRRPSVATRVVVIAVVATALLYFVAQAAAAGALLPAGL